MTVCLPVHNGQDAVLSALTDLAAWDYPGPVDIICVPNGCTDESAELARTAAPLVEARGWGLTVSEIETPHKVAALQHAESLAKDGWFVIHDVHVRPRADALQRLLRAAENRGLAVASGQLKYMVEGSIGVQRFSRAYALTPYARGDDLKGTFIAIAADQRHLISGMPGVGSDDRYFLRSTPRVERAAIEDSVVEYRFPREFKGLVRQQARWRRNNAALDTKMDPGDPPAHEAERWPYFLPRPRLLDAVTYATVWIVAYALAQMKPTESTSWSR